MIRLSLWLVTNIKSKIYIWLVKIFLETHGIRLYNDNWNWRNLMFSSHVTTHLQHTFQFPFFANQNYILAEKTPTHKKWIELADELVLKGLKVAAFEILPVSIMALFEIHQRFKDHFLNELRVSFKFLLTTIYQFIVHRWIVNRCTSIVK